MKKLKELISYCTHALQLVPGATIPFANHFPMLNSHLPVFATFQSFSYDRRSILLFEIG